MQDPNAPSSQEAGKLIKEYLRQNRKLGIKDLAQKTGLSYASILRYSKGAIPRPKNWQRIWEAISASGEIKRESLFFQSLENKPMTTEERSDPSTLPHREEVKIVNQLTTNGGWSTAEDRQEIFLPVHGFTWFYPEEMQIIDHPAFNV